MLPLNHHFSHLLYLGTLWAQMLDVSATRHFLNEFVSLTIIRFLSPFSILIVQSIGLHCGLFMVSPSTIYSSGFLLWSSPFLRCKHFTFHCYVLPPHQIHTGETMINFCESRVFVQHHLSVYFWDRVLHIQHHWPWVHCSWGWLCIYDFSKSPP